MNLPYEWAIQTKRPGDTRDYRILAQTPGEISEKEFDRIFRSLSIGELPGGSDPHNPPAPWLAFGPFTGGQAQYLACILQNWTEQQDARNRPISFASCLCLPFEQIAAGQATLVQIAHLQDSINLAAALRQIADGSGESVIRLARARLVLEKAPPLAALAARIDANGFEACAGIAATLLQEPIVLVGGKPGWEESLNHLDAILALLPYGARANASVSSWTRIASINSIRLSFSSGGSREKSYIAWSAPGVATRQVLPEKMHPAYFNLLLEARRRHTTLEILKHLSARTDPLTFQTPEPFLTALQALDRPYLILQSILSAQNLPNIALQASIRDLLADPAYPLVRSDRQKMLGYLLNVGSDPQNPAVLANHWSPELWNELLARNESAFAQENLPGLLYCVEVARKIKRLEDWFGMAVKAENLADRRKRGMVIQLAKSVFKSAPEVEREALFTLLAGTPLPFEFGLEWAQSIFKDTPVDESERAICLRLCASPQFAPRGLRIVLGVLDEALEVEDLNDITRGDPDLGAWLFTFAIQQKSLKNVTRAFSQWALHNASWPTPLHFQNSWENLIQNLENHPQTLNSVSCANFDVVWLNFSGSRQPLWLSLALRAPAEAFERYVGTFCEALEPPQIRLQNVAQNLETFLNQMLQRPLAQAEILRLGQLAEGVNRTLNDERLYMTQQKIKLRECLNARRPLKEMGACCARILNDKRIKDAPEFIMAELIETHFMFPTGGVDDLLAQLAAESPEYLVEFENQLIANILAGNFGPLLAATYRQRWAETISQEIDQLAQHLALLNPKEAAYGKVATELEAKLGKYLPKKGGIFGR